MDRILALLLQILGPDCLPPADATAAATQIDAACTPLRHRAAGRRSASFMLAAAIAGRRALFDALRATAVVVAVLAANGAAVGCSHVCQHPAIDAYDHPSKPQPAARLVLKCGDATWEMDLDFAPRAAVQVLKRCFEPPPGWKPGDPEPPGWREECTRP